MGVESWPSAVSPGMMREAERSPALAQPAVTCSIQIGNGVWQMKLSSPTSTPWRQHWLPMFCLHSTILISEDCKIDSNSLFSIQWQQPQIYDHVFQVFQFSIRCEFWSRSPHHHTSSSSSFRIYWSRLLTPCRFIESKFSIKSVNWCGKKVQPQQRLGNLGVYWPIPFLTWWSLHSILSLQVQNLVYNQSHSPADNNCV